MIIILREHNDSLRTMFLISSNAFKDREDEIIKQKALTAYVSGFKVPQPLLFWHKGDKIGDIVSAKMHGAFLIEIAKELSDAQIDVGDGFIVSREQVWDIIEKGDTPFGASIGFRHKEGDELDAAYDKILKFETSVLPLEVAANAVTIAHIPKGENL